MKRVLFCILLVLTTLPAMAQVERHDVRRGNREFKKGNMKEAELEYRRAMTKDSTSLKARYNLASALYRQEDYDGAVELLDGLRDESSPSSVDFNSGDVALQKKDYAAAVEAFRAALLKDPADLDAKESYVYAKKKLEDQQNQGGGGENEQNQDQNQEDQQPQEQPQNQPQDNNQDKNDNTRDEQPQSEPRISNQQAQQMLNAIQAKEKETQDKVKKEKAELLKSKQKEKNW